MGHQYGRSAAAALIDEQDFDAAVAAATKAIGVEPADSEHYWDRGQALSWLERYDEAIADLERAKDLDAQAEVLDEDMLDDAYFSALVGAARAKGDAEAGCATLQRYVARYPQGRHVEDCAAWQERLRGERKSHFVKER